MSKLSLFAIRHAETPWNAEGRFQGLSDVGLSDEGRRQAKEAGIGLRRILETSDKTHAVSDIVWLSSPLRRATATMAILREQSGLGGDGFVIDPRLSEAGFGRWEGMTTHEVKARYPDERRKRKADRWRFAPEGGTSYADLAASMQDFVANLPEGRAIVAVTHSGNLRVMLGRFLGLGQDASMALDVGCGDIWQWNGCHLSRL